MKKEKRKKISIIEESNPVLSYFNGNLEQIEPILNYETESWHKEFIKGTHGGFYKKVQRIVTKCFFALLVKSKLPDITSETLNSLSIAINP